MASASDSITRGDELRKARQYAGAIEAYREAIKSVEIPDGDVCLKVARCFDALGDKINACAWLCRVVDSGDVFLNWHSAASLLDRVLKDWQPTSIKRRAKVWLCGSYTTVQLTPMLRLAGLREGLLLEVKEGDFGQYRQEIIDPKSRMYAFEPDLVVMTVHHGEVMLPEFAANPQAIVEAELSRWTSLWQALKSRSKARLVMHNVAAPAHNAFGHLAARLPGSRAAMLDALNIKLGEAAAAQGAAIVDCERLSSNIGKRAWFNDKYWHVSKQAVSLEALPALARHTIAVIGAELGLSKKCLVLDLDNTLWGGVIGEDGLGGIKLGQGDPIGEAYLAFQQYIKSLQGKGVILAVCSKNNDADAREPFLRHPEMALKLDDFAMFVANWERKPDNLRTIAQALNIGLDSLVFVDDNPAEREMIRQFVPEVEVITLPRDPTGFVRALSDYLMFETAAFTAEDAAKTEQYRARAQIAELEANAGSIEDFYRSLQMQAVVEPFDDLHLPRIVQLLGKTNQFNLTTKRHGEAQVRAFMNDANCVHWYLKLRDRFADHGLVSMIIARKDGSSGEVMDIDTWLMSCRVIGRTVEAELLSHVSEAAMRMGCTSIRGTYIPTAKNDMVKEIFGQFGFMKTNTAPDGTTTWEYDLTKNGAIVNGFIERLRGDAAQRLQEQTVDA
jgi:FkbH-like protein